MNAGRSCVGAESSARGYEGNRPTSSIAWCAASPICSLLVERQLLVPGMETSAPQAVASTEVSGSLAIVLAVPVALPLVGYLLLLFG